MSRSGGAVIKDYCNRLKCYQDTTFTPDSEAAGGLLREPSRVFLSLKVRRDPHDCGRMLPDTYISSN